MPRVGCALAVLLVLILGTPFLWLALVFPPLVNLALVGLAVWPMGAGVRRLTSTRWIESTSTGVRIRLDGRWHRVDDCDCLDDSPVLLLERMPIRLACPMVHAA